MAKNKKELKQKEPFEVEILGMKVKTPAYVKANLPGRTGGGISSRTLLKYVKAGMPCFTVSNKVYFTDEDIKKIGPWLATHARYGGCLWMRDK